MAPIWIDAREAARITSFTPKHFENLRLRGEGPPFFRFGRQVRYRLADVIAWAEAVAQPGRAA